MQPDSPFDVVSIGEDSYSLLPSTDGPSPHYPPHSASNPLQLPLQTSLTSSSPRNNSKLELSPRDGAVRNGVLQEAYFPTWADDTAGGLDSPEELQKKDPLGAQIWKLYSKAKSQLPNAERMENLTWRIMSMNLRKLELERSKGFVHYNKPSPSFSILFPYEYGTCIAHPHSHIECDKFLEVWILQITRNISLSRRRRALSIHAAIQEGGNRIDHFTVPFVPCQIANGRLAG